MFDSFLKLLEEIQDALSKNDEMYNNLEILDKEQRFEIIFNSCPFIKKIKSATKDETNEYNDYIYKMIAKRKKYSRFIRKSNARFDDGLAEKKEGIE